MLKSILLAGAASALALSTAPAFAQSAQPVPADTPATTMPPSQTPGTTAPNGLPRTGTTVPGMPTTPGTNPDGTTMPGDPSTPADPAMPGDSTLPAPTTGTTGEGESPTDDAATTQPTGQQPTGTQPGVTASAQAAAPAGTIAAAVGANADLSTLGSALSATELTATLGQPGPFTVFAPTNQAFALIPEPVRSQLMQPANREALAAILKFHVVPGTITAAQLREQITAGGGTATLQTVAGQTLRASLEGEQIVLMGENNSKAYISSADNAQSNGTVHVINGILVPRLG
jgi:uncharacterized surface protein with fasciclin (FAS1) repeats